MAVPKINLQIVVVVTFTDQMPFLLANHSTKGKNEIKN